MLDLVPSEDWVFDNQVTLLLQIQGPTSVWVIFQKLWVLNDNVGSPTCVHYSVKILVVINFGTSLNLNFAIVEIEEAFRNVIWDGYIVKMELKISGLSGENIGLALSRPI